MVFLFYLYRVRGKSVHDTFGSSTGGDKELPDLRLGIVSSHICWKAVEIYTHVSNKDIGKSGTPLDNLQMGGGGDD